MPVDTAVATTSAFVIFLWLCSRFSTRFCRDLTFLPSTSTEFSAALRPFDVTETAIDAVAATAEYCPSAEMKFLLFMVLPGSADPAAIIAALV